MRRGDAKKVKRRAEIEQKLKQSFATATIEVIDESHQHIGHAGYQEGGESHFRVKMKAVEFAGLSRIARHRAVHSALGKPLLAQIHALALELDQAD